MPEKLLHMNRSLKNVFSKVRLQSQSMALSGTEKYTLDQFAVADIKCVLKDQQQAIQVRLSIHVMKIHHSSLSKFE